jgi:hypothetical protein
MEKNLNAFPVCVYRWRKDDKEPRLEIDPGMSLRDYFAAAVLSGICSREGLRTDGPGNKITIADFCFDMADTMIERREARRYKTIHDALADKNGGKDIAT